MLWSLTAPAFWAVIGTLLVVVLGGADGAEAETLTQALAFAYRSNPQLNAARARQRSDDENVPRALGGYDPTVAVTGDVGVQIDRDNQNGRLTVTRPVTIGLTVNQTLVDFGRTALAVRGAESEVFAGRENLRGVEQTVLLNAATAYMNVIRDGAIVGLQQSNVEFLLEELRITRKRVETGDLKPTGVSQGEARLARARADLATAGANLVASRSIYRQAVGREAANLSFPEGEAKHPRTLKDALAESRALSPAARNAAHLVDVASLAVSRANAELLPSVGLQGSVSRAVGAASDQAGSAFPSVALSLSVPIYDGGSAYALIRQAKETVAQRRIELEAVREQVRADVRSAWGALEAARASVPAAEAGVAATEIALAGVRREASEGQRTTLDVLNAQQELVNARAALLTVRRDRVVASYAFAAAVGRLTAAHLDVPGTRYRPEVHYRQVRDARFGTRTPDGR